MIHATRGYILTSIDYMKHLSVFMSAIAIAITSFAIAAPPSGPAVPAIFTMRLMPASGYSYSVAFAVSPTMAVGLSSNQPIYVKPNLELVIPDPSNTAIRATTWTYSQYTAWAIPGVIPTSFSSFNAAFYGVSNGNYSGTRFSDTFDWSSGFVHYNGTTYNFTQPGTNSWGFGIVALGGSAATGWALDGTIHRPVVFNAYGTPCLTYLSAAGISGSGYRCASAPEGSYGRIVGTANNAPVFWESGLQQSIPSLTTLTGCAFGLPYDSPSGAVTEYIVGADSASNNAFTYRVPIDTYAQSIPRFGYGIAANTSVIHVGSTPNDAFISSHTGTALSWLQSILSPGSSQFTSLQAAYDVCLTPTGCINSAVRYVMCGLADGSWDANNERWQINKAYAVFFWN